MTLVPKEVIQSETRLLSPLMTEEMVITVVTPMTMPRMVRPERSLFTLSVSSASLTDSRVWPRDMKNEPSALSYRHFAVSDGTNTAGRKERNAPQREVIGIRPKAKNG